MNAKKILDAYLHSPLDFHMVHGWVTLWLAIMALYIMVQITVWATVPEPKCYPVQCIVAYCLMTAYGLIPVSITLFLALSLASKAAGGLISLAVCCVAIRLMQKHITILHEVGEGEGWHPASPGVYREYLAELGREPTHKR